MLKYLVLVSLCIPNSVADFPTQYMLSLTAGVQPYVYMRTRSVLQQYTNGTTWDERIGFYVC